MVLDDCGIPPTHNRDKRWLARAHGWEGKPDPDYKPLAGCKIVADVLAISDFKVLNAWDDRERVL